MTEHGNPCQDGAMLVHSVVQFAASVQHVEAASFLQVIRNAVLIFLLIVFLIGAVVGGIVGYLIGRASSRR
jgi:membrane protein YqaA with SNARE-associated domain